MKRLFVSLLALALAAPSLAAVDRGVEVTLGAGYRFGGAGFLIEASGPLIICFTTPCVAADASTEEEIVLTLNVNVPLGAGPWMVEALYTEADGDLELESAFPPGDLLPETYDTSTFLVGVLRSFGDGEIRPFASAAIGRTRFETSALVYEPPIFPGVVAQRRDEEAFAASLAGGAKIDLGERWLARLEARVFFHDLPGRAGGSFEQGEFGAAIGYRF